MTDFRAWNDTPDVEAFYEPKTARELDALVAIRIFGWISHHFELNSEQLVVVPPDWTDFTAYYWWAKDLYQLVPFYSVDIEAAWRIVEHLSEWSFVLRRDIGGWQCSFGPDSLEFGETPSLAICRAALRASSGE